MILPFCQTAASPTPATSYTMCCCWHSIASTRWSQEDPVPVPPVPVLHRQRRRQGRRQHRRQQRGSWRSPSRRQGCQLRRPPGQRGQLAVRRLRRVQLAVRQRWQARSAVRRPRRARLAVQQPWRVQLAVCQRRRLRRARQAVQRLRPVQVAVCQRRRPPRARLAVQQPWRVQVAVCQRQRRQARSADCQRRRRRQRLCRRAGWTVRRRVFQAVGVRQPRDDAAATARSLLGGIMMISCSTCSFKRFALPPLPDNMATTVLALGGLAAGRWQPRDSERSEQAVHFNTGAYSCQLAPGSIGPVVL